MGNSKIKIFVFGRDRIGWSIDKDRNATIQFLKECGFSLTRNIFQATHIYCVWYDLLFNFKYRWIASLGRVSNKKIIAVIANDITYYLEKVNLLKKYVDICIVPSDKIYNFLKEQKINVQRIPFFVDVNIFRPLGISKREICKRLGIGYKKIETKFIIGSFQRDSLGKNLRKPKWQKNPDLLIKIAKEFPRDVILLVLAGPRRHYLISQCKKHDIPYLFYGNEWYIGNNKDDLEINNLESHKISLLYNLIDVYIVSSKSEGGPKAILEAAMTKTLILSTNVGLAPDILHGDLIYEESAIEKLVDFLTKILKHERKRREYVDYNYKIVSSALNKDKLLEKYKSILY